MTLIWLVMIIAAVSGAIGYMFGLEEGERNGMGRADAIRRHPSNQSE